MVVGDICTNPVITCTRDTPVLEVAATMRDRHVGAVVVVEQREGQTTPVGVITDRDIVVDALVPALDRITTLIAGNLLTRDIITVDANDNIDRALEIMSEAGVRRAPVVDPIGTLVGIVTVDDLIETFAARLIGVVGVIRRQQRRERGQWE